MNKWVSYYRPPPFQGINKTEQEWKNEGYTVQSFDEAFMTKPIDTTDLYNTHSMVWDDSNDTFVTRGTGDVTNDSVKFVCTHKFLDTDSNKTICVRCGRDVYLIFDADVDEQVRIERLYSDIKLNVLPVLNKKLKIAVDALNQVQKYSAYFVATGLGKIRHPLHIAKEALAEIEKLK